MKTVRDVMCPVRDVLQTSDSVADAARYLAAHDADSVALCRADGSLAGTVSNRDIVAQVVARELDPRQMPLSALIGCGDALTVDLDVSVEDAAAVMNHSSQERVLVTADERVVGSVTRRDMARTLVFRPSIVDL
jgi:CBS domain-containing protein